MNMQQLNDFTFSDTIIEIHEGEAWYSIVLDGLCCGLKKEYGAKPKLGDTLTIHTNSDKFGTVLVIPQKVTRLCLMSIIILSIIQL